MLGSCASPRWLPPGYTRFWLPDPQLRYHYLFSRTWWRHQMETFSGLLATCAGNSPVPGEFSTQRPVTRSFDVYFDLRPNKRLSKQWWGWWFEKQSRPLWRHRNVRLESTHFTELYDLGVVAYTIPWNKWRNEYRRVRMLWFKLMVGFSIGLMPCCEYRTKECICL